MRVTGDLTSTQLGGSQELSVQQSYIKKEQKTYKNRKKKNFSENVFFCYTVYLGSPGSNQVNPYAKGSKLIMYYTFKAVMASYSLTEYKGVSTRVS